MKHTNNNKIYSYGKQCIDEDDIQAVLNILRTDWLTQGPTIDAFEKELCKKTNHRYATALANGTAALHLTALALGWSKEDIVLTSPISFVATANCIVYAGATPYFVDIDTCTYTLNINKLEDSIKSLKNNDKRVKAVIGVDYSGHPCDWENLRFLADKYDFQLVNDACHAFGALYKNRTDYLSQYADASILSFHPVKHITTGEGGAVLTNDKSIDEKIKRLRMHGLTKDKDLLIKNDGEWYYEMIELGYNYRITDIQCALGMSQLKKLDKFIERRQEIAHYYDQAFQNNEIFIVPKISSDVYSAYHLYPLQILFHRIFKAKNDLFKQLKSNNIHCQVHYIPIHLHPYYQKNYEFQYGDYPAAEKFYEQEISIPMYEALTEEDLVYITKKILELVI